MAARKVLSKCVVIAWWALLVHALGGLASEPPAQGRSAAVASIKTDRARRLPREVPALPAAGGKFRDPVFGTEIMRVTDERDGSSAGTSYSYWPTFNSDNTRLLVMGAGEAGCAIYDFDPVNFVRGAKHQLPLLGGGYLFSTDLIWSASDPDVLYGHTGAALYAYNVRARTYTKLFDLASRLRPGHAFFQASLSRDGDVFAATLKDTSKGWRVAGYVAYRRSTDAILYRSSDDHNEVRVDKSGRYLFVNTNDQGVGKIEVKIVDLLTGAVTGLTDDAPDHAPAHYDVGTGTAVGNGNYLVGVSFRNLSTPRSFTKILDLSAEKNYGGFHVSMLADDEGWALISFYTAHVNGVMQGEVVQVATDGSGRVRRLLHHHSSFSSYYDSPRANV
ncbi:MAG TPA: hypothetical protein VK421_05400, partial [Pyrinomonadaceae bacterium]|nr:hypothetical protein [Pyrinomonadaceae bacterium]